jgi:hypothetical protein
MMKKILNEYGEEMMKKILNEYGEEMMNKNDEENHE